MFKFLDESILRDALPAGHHAIQLVRQWAPAAVRYGTSKSMLESLTPPQADLVTRIVQEIESKEGKPVTDLPEPKVDDYIRLLSARIEELSRSQLGADPDKGRALLARLRSESP